MKGFFSKCDQIRKKLQILSHILTVTEEILNEKLHILCSEKQNAQEWENKTLAASDYFLQSI